MKEVTGYNFEYSLVKAETAGYDEDKEIIGFYLPRLNEDKTKCIHTVCDINETENPKFYEVNAYTICRNTGLKDKNGKHLFEFDLIKIYSAGQFETYAYIEFSELYKGFIARTCDNGIYYLNKITYEVIGNVALSDNDIAILEGKGREIAKNYKIDYTRCTYSKPIN